MESFKRKIIRDTKFNASQDQLQTMKFLMPFILISNACFSQLFIAKEKAIKDIEYYNKTIEEVHANPFLFIAKKKYHNEIARLKKNIPDSISFQELLITFYKISALIKDGHNLPFIVQPEITGELKENLFFPLKLISTNLKLFVPKSTSAVSGLPEGAEVLSVNKIAINKLLPEFQTYFGGNVHYTNEMAERFFSYFLFLKNIKPPFEIEFIDSTKKTGKLILSSGIKFGEALAITMPHIKTPYSFKIVSDKLGYIEFNSMSVNLNKLDKFLDSCFTLIKTNNIKYVAIDIRNNSGGNSLLADLLLSYITTKKYTLMGGRKWKISERYKEYLKLKGDTVNEYLKKENGTLWELGSCDSSGNKFKNDNIFTGKVFLLTSPFTFSSANMLADGIKQFKIATIIGESTGENTNDFGEAFTFLLPNSKIKMQTTTSFDYGADCNRKNYHVIYPDKEIKPTLKDKISENDRALKYILSIIE